MYNTEKILKRLTDKRDVVAKHRSKSKQHRTDMGT